MQTKETDLTENWKEISTLFHWSEVQCLKGYILRSRGPVEHIEVSAQVCMLKAFASCLN